MMSSTTATSLGATVASSRAGAAGNATGEGEGGFLAALDAAQPESSAAAPPQSAADHPPAADEDGDGDATEAAAAAAALLQADAARPEDAAASEAGVDEALPDPATGRAPSPAALLAALRDAWSAREGKVDGKVMQAEGDALPATVSGPDGRAHAPDGALVSQAGLRQVLQLMGQQPGPSNLPGSSQLDAAAMDLPETLAQLPDRSGASAARLLQGMSELLAAGAQSSQSGEPAPLPLPASSAAPNSLLAAAASNFGSPLPQAAPATGTPAQTLHSAVGSARWAEELGSRLTLMTLRGQHEGSLTLTPEHLGPLEVRISVSHNTANVWFGAQHADARAALAEAMPRLRELFGNAGLTLGEAGVSQHAPRQGSRDGEPARIAAAGATGVEAGDAIAAPATRRVQLGLVDTYV
jgi:flagellar hook-length control protein FliK